jgi:hypothetical protein
MISCKWHPCVTQCCIDNMHRPHFERRKYRYSRERKNARHSSQVVQSTGRRPCLSFAAICKVYAVSSYRNLIWCGTSPVLEHEVPESTALPASRFQLQRASASRHSYRALPKVDDLPQKVQPKLPAGPQRQHSVQHFGRPQSSHARRFDLPPK